MEIWNKLCVALARFSNLDRQLTGRSQDQHLSVHLS